MKENEPSTLQNKINQQKQTELYALPEQEQRKKPVIFTPKVMILSLLALIIVSRNIYNYFTIPRPTVEHVQVDFWQNTKMVWERVWGYAVLTVVMFTLFIILRRKNDRYQEERLKKLQQQEQLKNKDMQKQRFRFDEEQNSGSTSGNLNREQSVKQD